LEVHGESAATRQCAALRIGRMSRRSSGRRLARGAFSVNARPRRATDGRRMPPEPSRRTTRARRFALLAALLAGLAVAAPARAANLWVAWEDTPAAARCGAVVADMFACVLGATNFNTLAAAYPHGRALTFAGTAVVGSCVDPHGGPDYACVARRG